MLQSIYSLYIKKQVLFALLLLSYAAASFAAEMNLNSSHGVRIKQINFLSEPPQADSNLGLLDIDLIALRLATGLEQGYINMQINNNWAVRNLKVMKESEYPYSHITTSFDLGVETGTDVSELSVSISISDTVLETYSNTIVISYAIDSIDYALGGVPENPVVAPPSPPTLEDALFGNPEDTDAIFQLDHPNIEAAVNQCMPASIANSLQYLENTTNLEIPHENKMGLKGDDTLVGQLDTHTDRTVISRRSDANSGTWGLEGKMSYLAANGLQDQVVTTHMGSGAHSGADNVSVSVDGKTAAATGLGTDISFNTLLNAVKEGQDCELVYAWPGGAHAVDAAAAGTTNGQPWIIHSSDIDQDSDSKGAGASGFIYAYLKDTDNDGQLNLNGSNEELVQVICEKYVPLPPALTVTGINDPAGHNCCVTPPPGTVDILLNGDQLTISGDAPWLPMRGTVNTNGNFLLDSTATVAGFTNVQNSFSGNLNLNNGTFSDTQITLGTEGGLPQQAPIEFDVNIDNNEKEFAAKPVIRANGFRDNFSIDSSDPLSISITFDAAQQVGQEADWWAVLQTSQGLQSYNLATGEFQTGLTVSHQGPLFNLPFTRLTLFNQGIAPGTYTFYFGIDLIQNGNLDLGSAIFDKVVVTIP